MSTPAVRALEEAGVRFSLHEYSVRETVGEGYGRAVALALDTPAARVFKTLIAEVDGAFVVAVVPVTEKLSMKYLARAGGAKKAAMADPGAAERLTGYVTGGISPFGQRRERPTFIDDTVMRYPTVFVSAGKRGLQVELSPGDLVAVTGGATVRLT